MFHRRFHRAGSLAIRAGLAFRAIDEVPDQTGRDLGGHGLRFHFMWDSMCQEFWDTC
jgi:hypothetical protein